MNNNPLLSLPIQQPDKQMFINKMISDIDAGEYNILDVYSRLKHAEHILKAVMEAPEVRSLIEDEVNKYGKGETPTANGFEIAIQSRKSYDYSNCGDAELELNESKLASIKKDLDSRKKFLNSLTRVIVEDGFEIKPPMISITTYPVLKEKKSNFELPTDDGLKF